MLVTGLKVFVKTVSAKLSEQKAATLFILYVQLSSASWKPGAKKKKIKSEKEI